MNEFVEMGFPLAGMDLQRGYWDQKPKPMPRGDWGRTTRFGRNVRGYERREERSRGGSRPGMTKWLDSPLVSNWIVQHLDTIVSTGTAPGGNVQTSQSGRVVTLVTVSQGNVKVANKGDTAWTTPTNNTGRTYALNYTGVMQSTALNQKLYFADGANWVYYDPTINTVQTWSASAGTLPVDSSGNSPRLCCTWRGRVVLSGVFGDPHAVFMSAVGDATNFDYFPTIQRPTQAVALTVGSPFGVVGDLVTSLCPFTDDVLIIGGDHTISRLQGDPADGGKVDLITDRIGVAWGKTITMDAQGNVYFLSNMLGIYRMEPGGKPIRISQGIEQLVQGYNSGKMILNIAWNDIDRQLEVFGTFNEAPAVTTHFYLEEQTGGWFMRQFANKRHNPLCCCVFDGNLPDDRALLIGSWDGYVRQFDPNATDDDGTPIESVVVLGPLNTKDLDDLLFKNIQAVLGDESGDVDYAIFVGRTAESALNSPAVASGTWKAGRNYTNLIQRAGHALYVRLTSSNAWAMEQIRAEISAKGKVRRRG